MPRVECPACHKPHDPAYVLCKSCWLALDSFMRGEIRRAEGTDALARTVEIAVASLTDPPHADPPPPDTPCSPNQEEHTP
jgi:hypothetical protein